MEFANERNLPLTELPEEFHILSGENSAMIIRGMQIYIGNPENGEKAPLVELTFFPSDLDKAFSVVKFAQFVEEVKQILQASWYYVRTENASWKFGTSGYGTGVIFQPSDVKDIT